MAWADRLQNVYRSRREFLDYDSHYGLAKRLGYSSSEVLWDENPVVSGSINPNDYKVYSLETIRKKNIKQFRVDYSIRALLELSSDGAMKAEDVSDEDIEIIKNALKSILCPIFMDEEDFYSKIPKKTLFDLLHEEYS